MVHAFESNSERSDAIIKSHGEGTFTNAIKWLTLMEFSNPSDIFLRSDFRHQLTVDRVMAPSG